MDLLELANSLRKMPANLEKEVCRCSVEVGKAIHHNLTEVTPVDTSTALSNWDILLGEQSGGPHEPYFMGRRGSTELRSERQANIVAEEILRERKFGEKITIANFVHYINELNDGKSTQEPAGFVERAVLVGKLKLSTLKVEVKL